MNTSMHKYNSDSADLFAYKSNRGAKYASSETHESREVSYKKRELSQMRHLIDCVTKDENNEKLKKKKKHFLRILCGNNTYCRVHGETEIQ